MERVNLFYVFLRLGLGGAQEISLRTMAHIDRSRFRVTVCCLAERGRLVSEVERLGVPVHCLNAADLKNDPSVLLRLTRLIRQHDAHIVHTYLYSRANAYARLAAVLARTPVIVAGAVGYGRPRPLKKRILDYVLARFTDHFTALSEATRAHVCREQGIAPDKVTVVYPGIEPERFSGIEHQARMRQELGIPTNALVVGTVTRLVPEKGPADLIDAVARIRQTVPDARLVIVGDGPLRSDLEQMVEGRGLHDMVHMTGFRRDVPELLQVMDVFALPSRREGFGMALVEAMAAGLPVVATDVGGIPEVVEHDVTGFLVPPHDIDALAASIGRLLEHPGLRTALGERGRLRVQQHFTARRTAVQVQELYLSLLARKGVVFSTDKSFLTSTDAS